MTLDSQNNTRAWFSFDEKTQLYNLITKKLIRILKKNSPSLQHNYIYLTYYKKWDFNNPYFAQYTSS